MPLFFFLSGYFLNTATPFWIFVKKRFNGLLKPYFLTIFLIYFFLAGVRHGRSRAGIALRAFVRSNPVASFWLGREAEPPRDKAHWQMSKPCRNS